MCGYNTVMAAAAAIMASIALPPSRNTFRPISAACAWGALKAMESSVIPSLRSDQARRSFLHTNRLPIAAGLCHRHGDPAGKYRRSEEHTSELQSRENLVCRLLLEKKNEAI